MIPYGFTYHAPETLDGVLSALAADPDGTALLAGGSWVVPGLGRGERTARQVVDLRRAGLSGIHATDGADGTVVRLGACVTYADILSSAVLAERAPVLGQMAAGVTGGPQIVGRATVGGSVVAARPGSDAPCALALLDTTAEIAGPAGARTIQLTDLWADAFTTTLAPDEVLVAFEFTAPPAGTGSAYVKVKHSTGSWPIVTAAATVRLDAAGRCERAALVIGGACATPFHLPLDGGAIHEDALRDTLSAAWEDELAPASYRAAVAPAAARRALTQACADAALRRDQEPQ
ncbi:FAD binding domain-containing protein [Streptomyces sp. NPDC057257]|uniref:FAD binding domain-containing protein n=1 Tax=Streptomyces sp. NPDC057257 TaxID=3346071 RepID=UPI0036329AFA